MGLQYENLEARVRTFMLEEIESDVDTGVIYISNYLNERGQIEWPNLLREAARNGRDDSLAHEIRTGDHLKDQVERRKPKGGYTLVAVPYTAHETLAEGEFNRYFCRGLCRWAIENGVELEVYRAKVVAQPRPASEQMIGSRFDPQTILDDLRATTGLEPALGLPPGPNSGLTLRYRA